MMESDRSITQIQKGMAAALLKPAPNDGRAYAQGSEEGWLGALGVWLEQEIERAEEREEAISDDELLKRVLDGVRTSMVGQDEEQPGQFANALKVHESAVADMVATVRKELEKCCVVVDGDEWAG